MPERNWGCRLRTDLVWKGWKTLTLENDKIKVTVLADKGSDIVEFVHKASDTDFMWWTPWGLQNRDGFTPSSAGAGGNFGDLYEGGWQDIFPSGGVANKHQGVEYGLHGETPTMPWDVDVIKDDEAEVAVQLTCHTYRTPFRLRKTLRLKRGKPALFIEEEATNLGQVSVDAMWGHHPSFGKPFLSPDCRVDLPGAEVVYDHKFSESPRFAENTEGRWPKVKGLKGMIDLSKFPGFRKRSADMFYLKNLKGNWYGLTHTKAKVGFGLCWDVVTFPYIWFWQVFGGGVSAPWWGRTYHCALEPFSSIPSGLAHAARAGTALKFPPGQTKKTWLTAVAYAGKSQVRKITRDGRVF